MTEQNLTKYTFKDGHEQIVDQEGKIIAVRDSKFDNKSSLLSEGKWPDQFVQGSIPNLFSKELSRTPRLDEYLVTARQTGLGQCISNAPIRAINNDFQFSA